MALPLPVEEALVVRAPVEGEPFPNSVLILAVSPLPSALGWSGCRMSTPASMRSAMAQRTEPQQW